MDDFVCQTALMVFLVSMVGFRGASHKDQTEHSEDDGLDKTYEKLEGKEGHVRNRQQEGHDEEEYLAGEDITEKTEAKRENLG